jgi:hypothetical protein
MNGEDDEHGRDADLDGDDRAPTVGDGEPDVDRRNQHESERVDGGALEPEERQRRRRLQTAPDHTPEHRRAQLAAAPVDGGASSPSGHPHHRIFATPQHGGAVLAMRSPNPASKPVLVMAALRSDELSKVGRLARPQE